MSNPRPLTTDAGANRVINRMEREPRHQAVAVVVEVIRADHLARHDLTGDGALVVAVADEDGGVRVTVAHRGTLTRRIYRRGDRVRVQRWVPKDRVERGDYDHIR